MIRLNVLINSNWFLFFEGDEWSNQVDLTMYILIY